MGIPVKQTITVVNKSGNVVKTSQHLKDLFKEAKSAYLEKRTELKHERTQELKRSNSKDSSASNITERQHRKKSDTLDQDADKIRKDKKLAKDPETSRHHEHRHRDSRGSHHSSTQSLSNVHRTRDENHSRHRNDLTERSRHEKHAKDYRVDREKEQRLPHRQSADRDHCRQHGRPAVERGYSDSFYINERARPNHTSSVSTLTVSNLRHSSTTSPRRVSQHSLALSTVADEGAELRRRHTDGDGLALVSRASQRPRSTASLGDFYQSSDSDLGSDFIPPPLPTRHVQEADELRNKMTSLQRLLQEANCAQHSAKAVIKSLENNPDAMAAVALTLAEISNLAAKMAPGALLSLKTAFPAVVALLLSPEFLIAGGLAVGVTIVSLGGYKIIKKIKRNKAKKLEASKAMADNKHEDGETSEDADGLEEVDDLDALERIKNWRRGIEPVDGHGAPVPSMESGTTTPVEVEYVTRKAGSRLREEGVLPRETNQAKSKASALEKDKAKEAAKMSKDAKKQKAKLAKQTKLEHMKEEQTAKESVEREKAEGNGKPELQIDKPDDSDNNDDTLYVAEPTEEAQSAIDAGSTRAKAREKALFIKNRLFGGKQGGKVIA